MSKLAPDSLMSLETYHKERPEFRKRALEHRKRRTVFVGPHVTLQFEDELTIRYQIQEMLRIEKTFDTEGIQDELDAYNPLIPDGANFKATQLIEFTDPDERKVMLEKLVGLEHKTYVQVFGHERVYAIADEDMERSTADKTSAVHFMRFELTSEMVTTLKGGAALGMGVDHPEYKYHLEEVAPQTQTALVADLK